MAERERSKNDYPGLPKAMTLLVIEDEARLRELLVDMAPDTGFTATGARSAEEAIRLMDAEPRDIVILDLNLPAMDGLEFLRQLRDRWPEAEVIILTGFGSLDAAREAIHLDVVEFLTKPCPLNQIEQALDRARRRIDADRLKRISSPPTAPAAIAGETLEEHERRLILAALDRNHGNRTATAAELGISRRTLHYRLSEYQKQGLLK
jgi:DNA-binding NtrC family response regulator